MGLRRLLVCVVLCRSEGFLGQSARINQSLHSSIHSSDPGPLMSDSLSVGAY